MSSPDSNDLFFIPRFARAVQEPEMRDALEKAFRDLSAVRDEFERGLANFGRFMNEAGDAFEQACALIFGPPPDSERRTRVPRSPSGDDCSLLPAIHVNREGRHVGDLRFTGTLPIATLYGINPGIHELVYDTGWILWSHRLEAQHLVHSACGSRVLSLAASTGPASQKPTLSCELLNGTLRVRVFAGFESGRIELEMR